MSLKSFCATCLLGLSSEQSLAREDTSIPVLSVAAIEAQDVPKMASDVHYQDPTMAYFGIDGINLKGRAETQ
jgi:hypothetical protein